MNREQKQEKGSGAAGKVVVAVRASKKIPKSALVWALTHVVQPGDCTTLLVVVPSQSSGRKLWGLPRFSGDCTNGHKKSHLGASPDQTYDITDSCSQMILQLHDVYDPDKINVEIKIISGSPIGGVALEAKRTHASWIVLDKQLKNEEKRCMEELQCNIVVMKRSQPKVLRLSLVGLPKNEPEVVSPLCSDPDEGTENNHGKKHSFRTIRAPLVTPNSSPELGTPFTATEAGTSSVSSWGQGTSPFFISEMIGDPKKEESLIIKENKEVDCASSDSDRENVSIILSTNMRFQPGMIEFIRSHYRPLQLENGMSHRCEDKLQESTSKVMGRMQNNRNNAEFSGNVRETLSLSRTMPLGAPPLCSICQHKAPIFGKPPRWFGYAELELATGGFSQANFLAEGGFGSVHRGILPDGQVVAVKQHKLASSQGDLEFCSEVEVLSCAQHLNVVMLIGYCIEDKRRLLVYEYVCNGSLDSHLYGPQQVTLEWSARQKIAVGSARGLRYLHEECRVGCIVHRDVRPNNILITHDFEPLVGDFGLARWQPDGDKGMETKVIGTFGYLAPEYAQSGQITEKADVYSFGVVLVELITGRKAVDLNRPNGQQCLTEWSRPLLEDFAIDDLIDLRLGSAYSEREVYCMLHVASLCIRRDPNARPRMSQVLRILEGEMVMYGNYTLTPGHEEGSQTGSRLRVEPQQPQGCCSSSSLVSSSLQIFNFHGHHALVSVERNERFKQRSENGRLSFQEW